jgi:hypothetical protein
MKIELDIYKLSPEEIKAVWQIIGDGRAKIIPEEQPEGKLFRRMKKVFAPVTVAEPVAVLATARKPRKNVGTATHVEKLVEILKKKPNKVYKLINLYRKLNIRGGSHQLVLDALKKRKDIEVIQSGFGSFRRIKYTGNACVPNGTDGSVRHEKPMGEHKVRSKYHEFLSRRIKEIMLGTKTDYYTAWRLAYQEYKKDKEVNCVDIKVVGFPNFVTVEDQYKPILISMIDNMIKNKLPLTFPDVNYPLNIVSVSEFKEFMRELISKNKEIKQYFGITDPRNFTSDMFNVYFK